MKRWNIMKILKSSQKDLSIAGLMSDEQVRLWIMKDYPTYSLHTMDVDGEELVETLNDAIKQWEDCFDMWLSGNADKFLRIASAIDIEYDPLSNYDKTSSINHAHTGTDTTVNGARGSDTDNKLRPFNATQYVNTTGAHSSINSATDTFQHGHNEAITEHTTGNIGVTTSQQMLQSEIDLRLKIQLFRWIIHDLVNDILVDQEVIE